MNSDSDNGSWKHYYNKVMDNAVLEFSNKAASDLTAARDLTNSKEDVILALTGIGNALLAQCVLLERIADRLDAGGIGVEVTQA